MATLTHEAPIDEETYQPNPVSKPCLNLDSNRLTNNHGNLSTDYILDNIKKLQTVLRYDIYIFKSFCL